MVLTKQCEHRNLPRFPFPRVHATRPCSNGWDMLRCGCCKELVTEDGYVHRQDGETGNILERAFERPKPAIFELWPAMFGQSFQRIPNTSDSSNTTWFASSYACSVTLVPTSQGWERNLSWVRWRLQTQRLLLLRTGYLGTKCDCRWTAWSICQEPCCAGCVATRVWPVESNHCYIIDQSLPVQRWLCSSKIEPRLAKHIQSNNARTQTHNILIQIA